MGKITILIPAGGTYFDGKTKTPISLVPVPNSFLIDHQLKMIYSVFTKDEVDIIILSCAPDKLVNHLKKKNYPCKVIESSGNTNEAFPCLTTIRSMGDEIQKLILIYGDLYFNKYTVQEIRTKLLAGKSALIFDCYGSMPKRSAGAFLEENEQPVEYIMYSLPIKWCQIALVMGEELAILKQIAQNPTKYRNYLGLEIINKIIELGGQFVGILNENINVTDIDCIKDLQQINQ